MPESAAQNQDNIEPTKSDANGIAEQVSQTTHTAVVGGRAITYTATAGVLVLRGNAKEGEGNESEKPKASIFYVAYTRNDVDDAETRPITFSFNGGPGSSSVWLHMGLLGPRRVFLDDDGMPPPPPFRLVDNEFSLLDQTDLVFIDPVSTGYSRPAPGEKSSQFHHFQRDIESIGEFIRLFVTRNRRWASPKFLIGESYGTTRAAALSGFLQDRYGMYLNGIMLISNLLNFQTTAFDPGNDLPFVLFLPSYTATAWFHKRLADELSANLHSALAQSEQFARTDYLLALMQGDALPAEERAAIIQKLAYFTGLSADYIEDTNLRVPILRFTKELLRDQRRTVGRLDSRYLGIDRDACGEQFEHDSSLTAVAGAYSAAFNHYIRAELVYESDLTYEILTQDVFPWDYDKYENQYLNVADTLREAMSKNPYLRVFVASGYFDLATPYFATRYTFDHLGIEPHLHENITLAVYEAGHMMYVSVPALRQLRADMARFVEDTPTATRESK
ncbi:MAG: hypothetical protein J5I90_14240 [Caldilineales bacterium]|nr:hypothetical protein [Caldilineales bacterium]